MVVTTNCLFFVTFLSPTKKYSPDVVNSNAEIGFPNFTESISLPVVAFKLLTTPLILPVYHCFVITSDKYSEITYNK